MVTKFRDVKRSLIRGYLLFKKALEKIQGPPAIPPHVEIPPDSQIRLDQAVVVITGSSRGIGFTLAEAFAKQGAAVVLNGRNQDALEKAYEKLKSRFPRVQAVLADVSSPAGSKKLVDETLQKFQKIDLLINNAGVIGSTDKKIWELEFDEWQSVLNTNLTGPFLCAAATIHWAEHNNHPVRIINVSSGIVQYGHPRLGVYHVSKAGLEALTLSIHVDSQQQNPLISVVSIKPRSTQTRLTKNFFSRLEV